MVKRFFVFRWFGNICKQIRIKRDRNGEKVGKQVGKLFGMEISSDFRTTNMKRVYYTSLI